MTLVNETSRIAQLTPAGMLKLSATMAEFGITQAAITDEIYRTVMAMSDEDYAESVSWYSMARQFARDVAAEHNTSTEIVAAVISAVSPRMPWQRNKAVAAQILAKLSEVSHIDSAIDAAKVIGLGLSANVAMAVKVARGEDIANTLTGTKRRSFYNNIVSPAYGDSVTVDTWMARAFMRTTDMTLKSAQDFLGKNEKALGGTGVGYYVIAESCRNVARTMGILPCQVQALYWVAVSGGVNGGRTDIS